MFSEKYIQPEVVKNTSNSPTHKILLTQKHWALVKIQNHRLVLKMVFLHD